MMNDKHTFEDECNCFLCEPREEGTTPLSETVALLVGNPVDGITVYGPFTDHELASDYAETHFRHEEWWLIDMLPADGTGTPPHEEEG